MIGWEDAGNDADRRVIAALARLFDEPEAAVLCEPSLAARRTTRPPDVVLIHPEAGAHVIEVKGVTLRQIEAPPVGGGFTVRYASGRRTVNPIVQASRAMFDVRDATQRATPGDLRVRFQSWVALPLIVRAEWMAQWGPGAFCPPELLFADDLDDPDLAIRLGVASREPGHRGPIELCPLDQLRCVWQAFGDNSVLYASAADRPARPPVENGTLGEQFDAAAEAYRSLSDRQAELSRQDWRGGPRLVRGVAGSGKTVVLANNLARRLERTSARADDDGLFARPASPPADKPRLLVVCFNRTLASLVRRRVEAAYRQRTGLSLPAGTVDVCPFNKVVYDLSLQGLWRYQRVGDEDDGGRRAAGYLKELDHALTTDPAWADAARFDAIYVDEGQDFAEDEFRLLARLCRPGPGGEPDLYVFYDDAQNLYARRRPNWSALGLNVRGGRSAVMTECFRNTRPIIEAAFNVLYGAHASPDAPIPPRDFADLAYLEDAKLVVRDGPTWRVRFARRAGPPPRAAFAANKAAEAAHLIDRLRWMLGEQRVRPEDVLVLTQSKQRVAELSTAVAAAGLPDVERVRTPLARHDRDRLLVGRGELAVSTVASAKGYDAPCVFLVSANEFPATVEGRAAFYVGCTRASEHLEVSAYRRDRLAGEFGQAVAALQPPP